MQLSKIPSRFERRVKIRMPGEGGSNYEFSLTPTYRYMSRTDYEAALKKIESTVTDDEKRGQATLDLILVDLKGVEDEDGKPIDGVTAIAAIKDHPTIFQALIAEFNNALSVENIRVKN
jgi:hypothetical protein